MARKNDPPGGDAPLFCDRCTIELHPGTGSFYEVRIEAVADPAPPVVTEEDLAGDLRAQIEQILAELQDVSAREAMDQVHRRLILYLCRPCFVKWIEAPTG